MHDAKDGFLDIFHTIKNNLDISSPIDKQKLFNIMFSLIITIDSIPMQDHYLHLLADQFHLAYEVLLPQYRQYAKGEGQFFLRQSQHAQDKKDHGPGGKKYQPEREELLTALFHNDFISTYIQTPQLRNPLLELVVKTQNLASPKPKENIE